ncbi:hypothetical protein FPV67DRAFT_1673908 [Lyophyllum atratum]|nr:hypothetical protein FPV67DRAFT_1673908 [Lyophyllum atratum]
MAASSQDLSGWIYMPSHSVRALLTILPMCRKNFALTQVEELGLEFVLLTLEKRWILPPNTLELPWDRRKLSVSPRQPSTLTETPGLRRKRTFSHALNSDSQPDKVGKRPCIASTPPSSPILSFHSIPSFGLLSGHGSGLLTSGLTQAFDPASAADFELVPDSASPANFGPVSDPASTADSETAANFELIPNPASTADFEPVFEPTSRANPEPQSRANPESASSSVSAAAAANTDMEPPLLLAATHGPGRSALCDQARARLRGGR